MQHTLIKSSPLEQLLYIISGYTMHQIEPNFCMLYL